MDIRDIRIHFHTYPIRFHSRRWKLEENRKTNIQRIRIRFHTYPNRFHPYRGKRHNKPCNPKQGMHLFSSKWQLLYMTCHAKLPFLSFIYGLPTNHPTIASQIVLYKLLLPQINHFSISTDAKKRFCHVTIM
jgi:hypothetical protein